MALFNRFIRLFKADMHAMLDHLEEPDVLLRQAVREMEDEVDQSNRQLKARELELKHAQSKIAALQESMAGLQSQLDLCFKAENDVLAKTLLRRKLENERQLKQLKQQDSRLSEEIQSLASTLNDQRRRLEAMQQKAAVFESSEACPHKEAFRQGVEGQMDLVTDEDVELAFLQEQQNRRDS